MRRWCPELSGYDKLSIAVLFNLSTEVPDLPAISIERALPKSADGKSGIESSLTPFIETLADCVTSSDKASSTN